MSHQAEIGAASWSRRDVLRAGVAGGLGMSCSFAAAPTRSSRDDRAVILLLLVGGPSAHETFDPKPDAPSGYRGPFGSIATRLPGVRVCEHLPRLADRLDRVSLLRGIGHDDFAIHEVGLQLLQTGAVSAWNGGPIETSAAAPHFGASVARAELERSSFGAARGRAAPPFVILPAPLGKTGVGIGQGQTAGILGDEYAPTFLDPSERRLGLIPDGGRSRYGPGRFGRDCWAAGRLVDRGARVVVVNAFDGVFDGPSWDVHGARPFATFDDYRRLLLPAFDLAFSALLDDLERRGRLENTLVVAVGEIGRAACLNAAGGRDHSSRAWSAVVAGGGVAGGVVVGATDRFGGEPLERPIDPRAIHTTCLRALGLDSAATSFPSA